MGRAYLSRTSVDRHMRVYAGWMIHRHHARESMRIGMEDDVDDSPRFRDRVRVFSLGFMDLLMTRRGRMIIMLVSLAVVLVGVGLFELFHE